MWGGTHQHTSFLSRAGLFLAKREQCVKPAGRAVQRHALTSRYTEPVVPGEPALGFTSSDSGHGTTPRAYQLTGLGLKEPVSNLNLSLKVTLP